MHDIQKQLQELQSIYKEDMEIVPEHCNTIGMWNWMKKNNYFDKLDKMEDVYDGLGGCWQPELEERQSCLEEEEGCWGNLALPPPAKVLAEVVEDEGSVGENSSAKESSPLFDRLQSLLVEVDEGSDGEEEDDDDDYLISSLPDFSPEEFIHGPNNNSQALAPITTPDDTAPDDAMLDVSALKLDQRTYIQLRAAVLVDATTTLCYDDAPSSFTSTIKTTKTTTTMNENNNKESIDTILSKMKSHLSTLHVQTNTNVASLQRKALSQVTRASRRQRRESDDETILTRYKQLQKLQLEQREEKQRQLRTSGRVKTGSNKFDGEQWLPW